MRQLAGRNRANSHLAFSPCGRFLAAGGSSRGVRVWDLTADREPETVLEEGHGAAALTFAPDGRLVVAFATGGVWGWVPGGGDGWVYRGATYLMGNPVALDPGGRWLVGSGYDAQAHHSIRAAWELAADGTAPLRWQVRGLPFEPRLGLPGGELFAADVAGRTLQLRRAANCQPVAEFPSGGYPVHRLAADPTGVRLAWVVTHSDGVTADGLPRLFVRTLADGRTVQFPGVAPGRAVAFHPTGRTLAVGGRDGIHILDADTLAEARAYDWGHGAVRAVAFATDGLTAAAASDRGRVVLWDVEG